MSNKHTREHLMSIVKQIKKNNITRYDPWIWKIPWRKEGQPTPVFLPGEFHGQTTGSQRVKHN